MSIQLFGTCAWDKIQTDFTWVRASSPCDYEPQITLGVFLIIGIVLLVAGMIKKTPQSANDLKQE